MIRQVYNSSTAADSCAIVSKRLVTSAPAPVIGDWTTYSQSHLHTGIGARYGGEQYGDRHRKAKRSRENFCCIHCLLAQLALLTTTKPNKPKHRLGRALFLLKTGWPLYCQISTDLGKILHTPIVVRSLVGRLRLRSAHGRLQAKPKRLVTLRETTLWKTV